MTKLLVIERVFEYNGSMEFGDPAADQCDQRTPLDAALDTLHDALGDLITAVESGVLDQLDAAKKVAVWRRFETLRNILPVVITV